MKDDNQQKQCPQCKAYEYFTTLVNETPASTKEAFHDAFDYLVEHVLYDFVAQMTEESYEEGHFDGYKVGYMKAYKSIGREITHTAETLERMQKEDQCGECDCQTDDECKLK